MIDFTIDLFNGLMQLLNTVLNYIFSFLPKSPFIDILDEVGTIPYLGYINYFVPIDKLITITLIWLGAISVFYLYQIVLRWVKAIDD